MWYENASRFGFAYRLQWDGERGSHAPWIVQSLSGRGRGYDANQRRYDGHEPLGRVQFVRHFRGTMAAWQERDGRRDGLCHGTLEGAKDDCPAPISMLKHSRLTRWVRCVTISLVEYN